MKLLLIEDEPKVSAFLKQGLEEKGFEVDLAYDGEMGRKLGLANDYDLVILDLIIPYLHGIDLCRQLNSAKPNLPVLIITALGSINDKLNGFEAGADDYLIKPFEFKELIARINVLTRRAKTQYSSASMLKVADLELNLDTKTAFRDKQKIELTAKEFALLELFMRNPGRVLSRAEIAEKVWEITFDTGTNIVDVYINILRKKIDKAFTVKLIQTRVGLGYFINEE